jgi:hypothetical protein
LIVAHLECPDMIRKPQVGPALRPDSDVLFPTS